MFLGVTVSTHQHIKLHDNSALVRCSNYFSKNISPWAPKFNSNMFHSLLLPLCQSQVVKIYFQAHTTLGVVFFYFKTSQNQELFHMK